MQICLSPHDMIASEAGDVEAMVHYLVSGFPYTWRVLEVLLTQKQAGTGIIKMPVKGPFPFQILGSAGGCPAGIRWTARGLTDSGGSKTFSQNHGPAGVGRDL